jgi:uncharacterized protein
MTLPAFPRHAALLPRVTARQSTQDLAHDMAHVMRVYAWALRLAPGAGEDPDLAGAAALVHDLANVPKESAQRAAASGMSADQAGELLRAAGYDDDDVTAITEAVRTCSWSRGDRPGSRLGEVLQDADRLDAMGAVGVARTLTTAQAMVTRGVPLRLYDPDDPVARTGRPVDDKVNALDHFFVKLLKLADGMHLPEARAEAARRHATMLAFLREVGREVGGDTGSGR